MAPMGGAGEEVAAYAPFLGVDGGGPTVTVLRSSCQNQKYEYEIVPAVLCSMCFVFGILYTFFGYRFFKAVMFLTGFVFGAVVTFMICLEKRVLPLEGSAGIALGAGVLCGLITMLVQYVGLFLTGFHLGALLALHGLVIMEWFYHPESKWVAFGSLFLVGIVFALLTLYFQKSLTMIGTAVFGGALILVCVDYFLDSFMLVLYMWDRIRVELEYSNTLCWYSWVILGAWSATAIIGLTIQCKFTGKNIDHQEALHSQRRRKAASAAAAREAALAAEQAAEEKALAEAERLAREAIPPKQAAPPNPVSEQPPPGPTTPLQPVEPSRRYRQLYQVRRFNGDIISQSYIKSVEHKLSPAMKNMISASEARSQTLYTPVNETT